MHGSAPGKLRNFDSCPAKFIIVDDIRSCNAYWGNHIVGDFG
jgi:hypothetical protein